MWILVLLGYKERDDMFLGNVGNHLVDSMASQPGIPQSNFSPITSNSYGLRKYVGGTFLGNHLCSSTRRHKRDDDR